jgi:hypothetical protein
MASPQATRFIASIALTSSLSGRRLVQHPVCGQSDREEDGQMKAQQQQLRPDGRQSPG